MYHKHASQKQHATEHPAKKRVIFLVGAQLRDANRGTPLRMVSILRQIKKEHDLSVCCIDAPDDLIGVWVPYLTRGLLHRILFLYRFVRLQKIQIILTATETGMTLPVILKILSPRLRIMVDLHSVLVEEMGGIARWYKYIIDKKIRALLYFYDHVFTVSYKLKTRYSSTIDHTTVIYGGVDTTNIAQPALSSGNIFTIGYMGNARFYQGLLHLFEAARILKKTHALSFQLQLVISDDFAYVQSMIKTHDLYDVTHLSKSMNHEDALRYMASVDVFVIPRPKSPITEYAFPSKLSEYLLLGRPVIATDVGPIPELVAQGCPCCVIDANDLSHNLAKKILELANMSPIARHTLGESGFRFAKVHLSWDFLGRKVNQIIANLD